MKPKNLIKNEFIVQESLRLPFLSSVPSVVPQLASVCSISALVPSLGTADMCHYIWDISYRRKHFRTLLNVSQSLVTFLSHLLSSDFAVVTVLVGFGVYLFVFTSRL